MRYVKIEVSQLIIIGNLMSKNTNISCFCLQVFYPVYVITKGNDEGVG